MVKKLLQTRFVALHGKITIVQAYTPTSDQDDNEMEEFYDQLQNVINLVVVLSIWAMPCPSSGCFVMTKSVTNTRSSKVANSRSLSPLSYVSSLQMGPQKPCQFPQESLPTFAFQSPCTTRMSFFGVLSTTFCSWSQNSSISLSPQSKDFYFRKKRGMFRGKNSTEEHYERNSIYVNVPQKAIISSTRFSSGKQMKSCR